MDKKIPDTVIGILEHSGEFVKIDEQGKLTLAGVDVNSGNINDVMNAKKGIVSITPDLYTTIPLRNVDPYNPTNYKKELQDLKDFLTFKGIEIDEEELKEFVESRKLAEKMAMDPNEIRFPADFKIVETIGPVICNTKGVAKIRL